MANCIYHSFKIEILNQIQQHTNLLNNKDCAKILGGFAIEITKNFDNGHISINLAMLLQNKNNNLKETANTIIQQITKISYVQSAELSPPGFINIRFTKQKWIELLTNILAHKKNYGYKAKNIQTIQDKKDIKDIKDIKNIKSIKDSQNIHNTNNKQNKENTEKINIEYISPNLTGPMHSGHQRIADIGHVISRCLKFNGHNVTEECYFNDDGNQIDQFIVSIYIRYLELINKPIPTDLKLEYLGDYVYDISKKLKEKYGENLDFKTDYEQIVRTSLEIVKNKLISFFKELDINFDVFISEKELRTTGQIANAIKILDQYLYKGNLPALESESSSPEQISTKNTKENTTQKENRLLLFKSTDFGDEKDRTVQKSNGEFTYFGSELAYFLNKIKRGFTKLIMIVGHDHIGCSARWHAVVQALNNMLNTNVKLELVFVQLVKYIADNKVLDMSKRKGNFISAEEMIKILSKDSVRIFMLSSKYKSELKFDFEKVKAAHKDNPVFYIQYAHVRICSVLRKAQKEGFDLSSLKLNSSHDNTANNNTANNNTETTNAYPSHENFYKNVELEDIEVKVLRLLGTWSRIIEKTITTLEPNLIITYMIKLSNTLHSLWNTNNYRILNHDNKNLTLSRLALLKAVQYTLQSGFQILNATPLEEM